MFLLFLSGIAFVLILLAVLFYLLARQIHPPLRLTRVKENPILSPIASHWWESQAVFNPAAFYDNGRVHMLYRAMGNDGISRIGYASSADGIHFDERLPYPVYTPVKGFGIPDRKRVYGPLSYDTQTYASGGGWGGSEDPRLVRIDDHIYMTFEAFDGWGFVRMALTSIRAEDFHNKNWQWQQAFLLSPPGEINKNWVLFPEKIREKYAVLTGISPHIEVHYVDNPNEFDGSKFLKSNYDRNGRPGYWDNQVRGAGAPPLKTAKGWLLFYHGFDSNHPDIGYKVGAMLLDLEEPTKILYRSHVPVLESKEWYENDWKPGVTYATGAVIIGDTLFVYYGGGDKRIAVAKENLDEFLKELATPKNKV